MPDLEELLYVERIHAGHFEEWAKRATDPTAKMVFRLAADKERNHVGWVELMIEIAKARAKGKDLGVTRDELSYWVDDESGEGASYERLMAKTEEPWIRAALRQMAHDETTNAELLEGLLAAVQ
jgi:rubrerythrin